MFAVEDLISDYVDLKVSVRGQVLTVEMIYSSLRLGHTFQPAVGGDDERRGAVSSDTSQDRVGGPCMH